MKERINQAISETKAILKKAESYSEDLQDKSLIEDYRAHLLKMETLRESYK